MAGYVDISYIKDYLGITTTDKDSIIQTLIDEKSDELDGGERFWIDEKIWYQRPVDDQGVMMFHYKPVKELEEVTLVYENGTEVVKPSNEYTYADEYVRFDVQDTSGHGFNFDTYSYYEQGGFRYRFKAKVGYFAKESVPSDIKSLIRQMVVQEYNAREDYVSGDYKVKSKRVGDFTIDYNVGQSSQSNISGMSLGDKIVEVRERYGKDTAIYMT